MSYVGFGICEEDRERCWLMVCHDGGEPESPEALFTGAALALLAARRVAEAEGLEAWFCDESGPVRAAAGMALA